MPHFTVMIGADGPPIDLVVAVGRAWHRRRAAQGTSVPSPTTVRARIDTGSALSVVQPQVLQRLGVQATGSVRVRRPGAGGGFRLASMFDTQLSISGISPGAVWMAIRLSGFSPNRVREDRIAAFHDYLPVITIPPHPGAPCCPKRPRSCCAIAGATS